MKGEGLPTCLDCGQPIIWVQTIRGYMTPIDPAPVEEGCMAITDGEPPTVRYVRNGETAEPSEWLAISHKDTCPTRDHRPPKPRSDKPIRRLTPRRPDLGYVPGLLSGHDGPCAACFRVVDKLVTDHCKPHGQVRGDVCMSCNFRLAQADDSFWLGDIDEIATAYLDHLRRCTYCAREIDHLSGQRES